MQKFYPDDINDKTFKEELLAGEISNAKIFLFKDSGIDSKIFHVWKSKGLVDFIERGKWARLNFMEYLWLQVLETMRKFGCSVELMKKMYDHFFTRAIRDNIAINSKKNELKELYEIKKNRKLTYLEELKISTNEALMTHPTYIKELQNHDNYFTRLALNCLHYKADSGIIIFEDRTFMEYINDPKKKEITDQHSYINKPHLLIPISHYIIDFLGKDNKIDFLRSTGLLDEDELRVVKEMRNKNLKTLKITFKEKGCGVEKIECDKHGLIQGDEAKKIMKLLGLKNYSAIVLNTRDGKTLSFKHTEKKML